jgi:hypothetical protein
MPAHRGLCLWWDGKNNPLKRSMKMEKYLAMLAIVATTMVLASASWAQSGAGDSTNTNSGTNGAGGHHHHHKGGSTPQDSK